MKLCANLHLFSDICKFICKILLKTSEKSIQSQEYRLIYHKNTGSSPKRKCPSSRWDRLNSPRPLDDSTLTKASAKVLFFFHIRKFFGDFSFFPNFAHILSAIALASGSFASGASFPLRFAYRSANIRSSAAFRAIRIFWHKKTATISRSGREI